MFKNFAERLQLKIEFPIEGLHGGALVGARGGDFVCFYDWGDGRLVRRIDVGGWPEVACLYLAELRVFCSFVRVFCWFRPRRFGTVSARSFVANATGGLHRGRAGRGRKAAALCAFTAGATAASCVGGLASCACSGAFASLVVCVWRAWGHLPCGWHDRASPGRRVPKRL